MLKFKDTLLMNQSDTTFGHKICYSNTMLWGSADGKDVHLITLKTEKLEASWEPNLVSCDLMKLPTSFFGCFQK